MKAVYTPTYLERKRATADRNAMAGTLLFFLLWPLGSMFYALYHYSRKESKVIFILFTGLYGYSMVAESTGLDLSRFLNSLQSYASVTSNYIGDVIGGVYSKSDDASADIYVEIISFIVSRFTINGSWLMLIFGLVYGYVYAQSISLFASKLRSRNLNTLLLIICFSSIFGLDMLAGVRFATAAYIFFYGAIRFFTTSDKRYLLIILLAPLVHFSYLLLVAIFGMFLILRKYPVVIYAILLLSFIIPNLIQGSITQLSFWGGGAVEKRTNLYIGLQGTEEAVGVFNNWYVRYREGSMLLFAFLALIVLNLKSKIIIIDKQAKKVYLFSLLILSLVNFTQDIPHLGYRLQFVFLMFVVYYVFIIYNSNYRVKSVKSIVIMILPFFSLEIIYSIRNVLATSSPWLYTNEIIVFVTQANQSLWTILFK